MFSRDPCWVLRRKQRWIVPARGRQDINPVTRLQSRTKNHKVEKVKRSEDLVEPKIIYFPPSLPPFTCARSLIWQRICNPVKSPLFILSSHFYELACHQHCIWNGIYCVGGKTMDSYFCSNYENGFYWARVGGGGRGEWRKQIRDWDAQQGCSEEEALLRLLESGQQVIFRQDFF